MIPDTPRVKFAADLTCLGHFVHQITGYAYSLDDQPILDVVTWEDDDGNELELCDPSYGARYSTPMEDAIAQALWKAARSIKVQSLLHEAFCEWVEGNRIAAQGERHLRMVG